MRFIKFALRFVRAKKYETIIGNPKLSPKLAEEKNWNYRHSIAKELGVVKISTFVILTCNSPIW